MLFPDFKRELQALAVGYDLVAGCDEAGRGPVAGPVVAAACILRPEDIGIRWSRSKWYSRVRDSKTVPEEEREILAKKIIEHALAHGIGIVSEEDIDRLNIHNASLLAMQRAVLDMLGKLEISADRRLALFVDGRFTVAGLDAPGFSIKQTSVIQGDARVLSISAASIVAKVERDAIMRELDRRFPEYGFGRHKGYKTREHAEALRKFGASAVHRKTFIK